MFHISDLTFLRNKHGWMKYTRKDKKFSRRRKTARRFVSLNILLSHSRSFEMTLLSRACVISISIPLKLCLYLVPFLRYSASKNSVTLKTGLGVDQGQ